MRAGAVGIYGGVTYYFCSAECKAAYRDPRRTPRTAAQPGNPAQRGAGSAPAAPPRRSDPAAEPAAVSTAAAAPAAPLPSPLAIEPTESTGAQEEQLALSSEAAPELAPAAGKRPMGLYVGLAVVALVVVLLLVRGLG